MTDRAALVETYARALEDYVGGAGEDALARGYELGREALGTDVSVTDLAGVHHQALLRLLSSHPVEQLVVRAGEFLSEVLAPFEMTQRGYRQAFTRLVESQRQTQIANQELEAFSYSVAHDLRAPLRVVEGFSEALEEDATGALDDAARGHLAQIRAGTRRMGMLIEDLLRLSRIGTAELEREAVDMSELARSVCGDLTRSHSPRTVDWHVQDGMQGSADLALLRIAFENLLGNAWKFTSRRDAAKVRCTAETVDEHLVYSIEDNGAGFDPAHATRLFSPFQRLHPASDFEGNGIGLAIVQRVVRRHGGEIWAEGRLDAGATFHFSLDWHRA